MLRLDRIDKRHAGTAVLSHVSLDVAAGESVLVTGTARATSALLRIAATLIPPDSGSVHIDGVDARRDPYNARQRVTYVGPGAIPHEPDTPLRDLWRTARAGRGVTGTSAHYWELVDHAGVDPARAVSALPPEVRQAFAIALALDTRVPVVLLDDPFAGLDDQWTARISDWMAIASRAGTAFVVVANDVSRVERICARIAPLAS